MDPQILVEVTGENQLRSVADEVTARLQAAVGSLGANCPAGSPQVLGGWVSCSAVFGSCASVASCVRRYVSAISRRLTASMTRLLAISVTFLVR